MVTLGGGRAGEPVWGDPATMAVDAALGGRIVHDGDPRTGVELPATPRENPEDSACWTLVRAREGPAALSGDERKLPGTTEPPSEAFGSPKGLLFGEARSEPACSRVGDSCIF